MLGLHGPGSPVERTFVEEGKKKDEHICVRQARTNADDNTAICLFFLKISPSDIAYGRTTRTISPIWWTVISCKSFRTLGIYNIHTKWALQTNATNQHFFYKNLFSCILVNSDDYAAILQSIIQPLSEAIANTYVFLPKTVST